jgi:hypothetical protein
VRGLPADLGRLLDRLRRELGRGDVEEGVGTEPFSDTIWLSMVGSVTS